MSEQAVYDMQRDVADEGDWQVLVCWPAEADEADRFIASGPPRMVRAEALADAKELCRRLGLQPPAG